MPNIAAGHAHQLKGLCNLGLPPRMAITTKVCTTNNNQLCQADASIARALVVPLYSAHSQQLCRTKLQLKLVG
jgi:hypothetical protein